MLKKPLIDCDTAISNFLISSFSSKRLAWMVRTKDKLSVAFYFEDEIDGVTGLPEGKEFKG